MSYFGGLVLKYERNLVVRAQHPSRFVNLRRRRAIQARPLRRQRPTTFHRLMRDITMRFSSAFIRRLTIGLAIFMMVGQQASALTFKSANSSKHDDIQKRTPVKMQASPIDSVTLPAQWPFDPANALSTANRDALSIQLQDDFSLSKGQAQTCRDIGAAAPSAGQLASCIETVALEFYRSGSMAHFEPTLVNMAQTDPLTYVTKPDDFSPERYKARAVMTVYGAFYAYYYDAFEFDAATRQLVDGYFERKLTYLNMDAVGESAKQRFCDPRKPDRIGITRNGRADINTCESNRWKATIAQLLLGMRLKNETLFQRGVYNTKFMLLLFDEDGIFIPWATRGALAIHYSNEVPRFLSKLTEIYHALGYDFLEHELENGLRVKDLYRTYFEIYGDKGILDKYAKRRYAAKGESYSQYQQRSTADELRRWNLTKASFARESMRYITRYRPDLQELIACDFRLRLADGEPQRLVSSFSAVDSYEFHLANFPDSRRSEEYCDHMAGAERAAVKAQADAAAARMKERGMILQAGGWKVTDSDRYVPGTVELTETVKPSKPGKSTKYRFRIEGAGDVDRGELVRGGATIYVNSDGHKTLAYGMDRLFRRNPELLASWTRTTGRCGLFDGGEIDWIEVPIRTEWRELNDWFDCVVNDADVVEDGMLPIIRTLVFLGSHLDPGAP